MQFTVRLGFVACSFADGLAATLAFLQVNTATPLTSLFAILLHLFYRAPRYMPCPLHTTVGVAGGNFPSLRCYKGRIHRGSAPHHDLACSPHHHLDAASPMPTSATENDRSTPPGRKRAASSALQLGPRKKPCAIVINLLDCELILHQDYSGPLSAPWASLWQDCPRLLQCANAHHQWSSSHV